jgi:hypothetical protein
MSEEDQLKYKMMKDSAEEIYLNQHEKPRINFKNGSKSKKRKSQKKTQKSVNSMESKNSDKRIHFLEET